MNILVKDMEMPKSCSACFVREFRCPAIRKRLEEMDRGVWIPTNYRHQDCPLVAIPPHGRLIDADKLLNSGEDLCEGVWGYYGEQIVNAPTVIEAEEIPKNET